MKLERLYTVPLGDAYKAVRKKRAPRAVRILKAFIARHMKADGGQIALSNALNAYLWQKSIAKPPRRVKVRLIKEDGAVKAYLADEKIEEPAKKEAPKAEEKKETKPPEKKEEKPAPKVEEKKEKPAEKKEEKPAPKVEEKLKGEKAEKAPEKTEEKK